MDSDSSEESEFFYDALDDWGQLAAERKTAVPLRDKMINIQRLTLTKKPKNFKKNMEGKNTNF